MRRRRRRRHVWVAVVLGVVMAAGCDAGTPSGGDQTSAPATTIPESDATVSGDGSTTSPTQPATSSTQTATTFASVGPESGVDAAWIGGFGCGASALAADGTWSRLREEYGTLDNDQVMDVVVGSDNTTWIATSTSVERVTAGMMTRAYDRGFDALAVDPVSGDLWGIAYQEAVRFDGTSWESHPSTDFGEGEYVDLVKDVAVDAEGHPWVATTSTVAMLEGDTWTWWGVGQGFPDSAYPYYLESIAVAPDGRVWTSTTDGVLVFDGDTWLMTDPGVDQPKRISVADDGRVFVASFADGFATYEAGAWRVTTASAGGLPNDRVRAVEVDDRGRMWVGTTWGVSVSDAGAWTTYTMATSGMAGNCVETLAIDGGGPPEVPAPTTPEMGSLTGVIRTDGQPLANASVVLCSDQPGAVFTGDTPCSGQPYESVAVTDTEGRFTFTDVPIGDYELAWQVDEDTWRSYLIGGEDAMVRPGRITELEAIESETD